MARSPSLIVLSAPSGGGKTSIAKRLLATRGDLAYSISATTRRPRENEQDGVDYHFLSLAEFTARRDRDDFVEWAEYGGHWYGTPVEEVERILASGKHVLLDIEVDGAGQLEERRSDVVSIFILPPTAQVLIERLGGRSSDSAEQVVRRIKRAVEELVVAPRYDYVVINDDLDRAVADVDCIIDGHPERARRVPDLDERLATLRSGLEAWSRTA